MACRYAAAAEALRILDGEVAITGQRMQALKNRWLPRLRAALAELEFTLEEREREDGARLRRLAG